MPSPYRAKGCMQRINSVEHIPSTSPNKRRYSGGTVKLKLECGHEVIKRASAMTRKNGQTQTPQKAQCWECVALK